MVPAASRWRGGLPLHVHLCLDEPRIPVCFQGCMRRVQLCTRSVAPTSPAADDGHLRPVIPSRSTFLDVVTIAFCLVSLRAGISVHCPVIVVVALGVRGRWSVGSDGLTTPAQSSRVSCWMRFHCIVCRIHKHVHAPLQLCVTLGRGAWYVRLVFLRQAVTRQDTGHTEIDPGTAQLQRPNELDCYWKGFTSPSPKFYGTCNY